MINVESQDEIGELASSFNEMTENLHNSTTSIDNLNKEIIERKKVENAVKESEKKYKELVENINDIVFQLSPTGFIQYVSPIVEKLYGRCSQRSLDKKIKEFLR